MRFETLKPLPAGGDATNGLHPVTSDAAVAAAAAATAHATVSSARMLKIELAQSESNRMV